MKKALFYWFAFLLTLLFMTSCKSRAVVASQTTRDSIIETVKDTVFEIPKDSSSYTATLEVQDGVVKIKSVEDATPGRKLKAPKVTIKDNVLTCDCEAIAEQKFVSWKETFLKSFTETNFPVITNELTWWQETQIYIGRIALIALLVWLLTRIIKSNFF